MTNEDRIAKLLEIMSLLQKIKLNTNLPTVRMPPIPDVIFAIAFPMTAALLNSVLKEVKWND